MPVNILKVEPDLAGGIIIHVGLSDGVSQNVEKEYRIKNFDLDSFKRLVQSDFDALASTGTQKINLPIGPFDTSIVTPDPTPSQLYSQDIRLLRGYVNAISLGVLKSDDAGYLAQLSKVKQGFDVSLIGLF